MNISINPAALSNPAAANIDQNSTSGKEEGSFLDFMTRRMMQDDSRNLLGVASCLAAGVGSRQAMATGSVKTAAQGRAASADAGFESITTRLRELLDNLSQSLAQEQTTPGEWKLSRPDASLLTRTAQDAGMSRSDLDVLLNKMEENGGALDLTEILTFFANHFAKLDANSPITLPETELPFLESLLARMGVGPEEIQKISTAAVIGDNRFDLKVFVAKLNELVGQPKPVMAATEAGAGTAPQAIFLTNGEKEQLVDLLRQAGAGETMLAFMFQATGEEPNGFGLAELKDMLGKGIDLVELQKPKFNPKNFFADLAQVLTESGFAAKSVALTPMVQKAVESLYRELVGMVEVSGLEAGQAPAAPLTLALTDDGEDGFAPDMEKSSRLFDSEPDRLQDLLKQAGAGEKLVAALFDRDGDETAGSLLATLRQVLAQGRKAMDRAVPPNPMVDLQALVAALESGATSPVQAATIPLTSQEKGQLLDLFQQSGAGMDRLAALFEQAGDDPAGLPLPEFRQILAQGIKAIEAKEPQAVVAKFLADLSQVLAKNPTVGQPTARPTDMRAALETLARELGVVVDFTKIQVRPAPAIPAAAKPVESVAVAMPVEEAMPVPVAAAKPVDRGAAIWEKEAQPLSSAEQEQLVDLFRRAGADEKLLAALVGQTGDDRIGPPHAHFRQFLGQGLGAVLARGGKTAEPQVPRVELARLFDGLAQALPRNWPDVKTAAAPAAGPTATVDPLAAATSDLFTTSTLDPLTVPPGLESDPAVASPVAAETETVVAPPAQDTTIQLSSPNALLLADLLKQAGIEDGVSDQVVYLTNQDKDRMLDLFRQAGIAEEQLAVIFNRVGDETAGLPVLQLKEMLAQGFKAIELTQPQADLTKLSVDLGQVLAGGVLPEPAAGMSPVVQQTMDTVFQELVGAVDRAQIEPRPKPGEPAPVKTAEANNTFTAREERPVPPVGNDRTPEEADRQEMAAAQPKSTAIDPPPERSAAAGHDKPEVTPIGQADQPASAVRQADALRQVHVPRSAPDFERQTLMQMTSGVLRGLRTGEHHMVLKLKPAELGEVRVELLVKDHQVSVNFAMENSKVKEILENNMGMFKEHMADKGFNLQECKVSVGQDNQRNDSWQQFAENFKRKPGGPAPARLSDLSREVLYNRPDALHGRPDGISIVV